MYGLTSSRVNSLHRRMVFRFIWKRQYTSRPEISRVFGFSKSTVSGIIQSLEDDGLVMVSGLSQNAPSGRKAELLSINPEGPKVVSILLKDTGEIDAALLSLRGKVIGREQDFLSQKTPEYAVQRVLELIRSLAPFSTILGVGIGLPGIVDHLRGRIEYSAHFQWRDVPFGEMVQRGIPYPVFVENRTVAATLGETWFGKGLESRNLVCLHCGDTLGAGIVIGEKIYRGNLLGAGEVGHIPVAQAQETLCSCGRRGCAETVVGFPAIMEKLKEPYQNEHDAFCFLRDHRDDPRVRSLLEEAFVVVGEVTAILLNILAPEKVIFAGALPRVSPSFFLDFVVRVVAKKALTPIFQKVSLELSLLGEEEEALWGQAVVMERLFAMNYPLGG
ncbi:MAG: ROK family transcriptional regulator [Atribacterota bacterium]